MAVPNRFLPDSYVKSGHLMARLLRVPHSNTRVSEARLRVHLRSSLDVDNAHSISSRPDLRSVRERGLSHGERDGPKTGDGDAFLSIEKPVRRGEAERGVRVRESDRLALVARVLADGDSAVRGVGNPHGKLKLVVGLKRDVFKRRGDLATPLVRS